MPSPEEMAKRDLVTVGIGGAYVPDHDGSNDYRLIPAAAIRAKIHGYSVSTRGLYLYVNAIPDSAAKMKFDVGPIVGARLNRRGHIEDEVVELLPKRKMAIEVGAFGGVSFHGLTNPYDSLSLRIDVVHDVANAHQSTLFGPNIDFSTPVSRTTYVSANVGAEFVGNKYADYYFSISPEDSLVSGLPVFNAGGGMKNWKAGLLANQSITGNLLHGFSVFGAGQYSRLVGDFKRSPIVSERGNASQWLLAAGLAYTW